MTYPVTAALVGVALAFIIVWLVRKDRLYARDALFWIVVAGGSVVFAAFPRAIDWLGHWAGVAYPPALLLGLLILVLLIKALISDIALTTMRRDVRRLAQSAALREVERPQGPARANMPQSLPEQRSEIEPRHSAD